VPVGSLQDAGESAKPGFWDLLQKGGPVALNLPDRVVPDLWELPEVAKREGK